MSPPAARAGRPKVVVVGLGPAGVEHLTAAARDAIDQIPVRFVRTTRHEAVAACPAASSFDHHYETAGDFAEVYRAVVEDLVAAARRHGEVLYAVPGSPRVLERSVELLVHDARVEVEVVAGMSFLDLAWDRLDVDPIEAGVRLVDGHVFASAAAGEAGPLLVAHCHAGTVLSDIKLATDGPADAPVTVLQRLGHADEAVFTVPWAELDRSFAPDHLTALWIPTVAEPVAAEFAALDEVVRVLRLRCPWDRRQTHTSLTRHLLEETYEVLDALEDLRLGAEVPAAEVPAAGGGAGTDLYDHLEEELGDLLYQIAFHARLAAEAGAFTFADVARTLHDKLVRRHPHVFGDAEPVDVASLSTAWEARKREEKGRASALDGIVPTLPALAYAAKVVSRATPILDVAEPGWRAPLTSGLASLSAAGSDPPTPEQTAAALLAVVTASAAAGVDAEAVLRAAARRLAATARRYEAPSTPAD